MINWIKILFESFVFEFLICMYIIELFLSGVNFNLSIIRDRFYFLTDITKESNVFN